MVKRKTPFRTTNNLIFNTYETPINGFAGFKLGDTVGLFSQKELITDVVPSDMPNPEHLIDLVEWFCEFGRLSETFVRVSGPRLPEIEYRLLTEFKFYKTNKGQVMRGEWVKSVFQLPSPSPLTKKTKTKNARFQKPKSKPRR